MSNLRIKYKKLKQENERLRNIHNATLKPYNIISNSHNVVRLRSSLQLTEDNMIYSPQCVEHVKQMLLEEVGDYIKVKSVKPVFNNPGLPFSTLVAEVSIVKED